VVALAAFYPFGVFYSALYSESVFLLGAVGAIYHFRRHELVRAAAFGLLAGLSRPNGFLVSSLLGLATVIPVWQAWRGRRLPGGAPFVVRWPQLMLRLLAASAPVAGMLLFSVYVWTLTGDPFTWTKLQQAWGRSVGYLGPLIGDRVAHYANVGLLAYIEENPSEILNGAAALVGIFAVGPIVRRIGLEYGVFVALCILPPFISAGTISLGRYTAPLFPIFLWLAAAIPAQRRLYWVAAFAAGQALVAALFFSWRPPY
jgi:hypothetical protein